MLGDIQYYIIINFQVITADKCNVYHFCFGAFCYCMVPLLFIITVFVFVVNKK
jgi:hypothetical protein